MRLVRRERERIDVHIFNPSIPHSALCIIIIIIIILTL
jgi:hypothetical protein